MRRFRPHRAAIIVLALLVAAAYGSSVAAARVVDDNEARLLRDRTAEVRSLLESLASSFEANMVSVAAIAQVTDGDQAQFQAAAADVGRNETSPTEDGWRLLRRGPEGGWVDVAAVGAATPVADLPPAWASGLDRAAGGTFTVLGFLGEGVTRRIVLASGRPAASGDLVVTREASLIGATATTAAQSDTPITGLAIEVYVGSDAEPANLLLSLGAVGGDVERVVADIAGTEVLLMVSATTALGGGLAARLPQLLLAGGAVLGLAIAAVVEMSLRRRDDALITVRDLERQNRRLDAAFRQQQASEAARMALEAELRQAQRLEAVGHLAGGVAHDFNNVLAAILSYADLAMDATTDAGARADLEAIQEAARRGAGLTRQLLQFSRSEPGQTVEVHVDAQVAAVVGMLKRTVGDSIALHCSLEADQAVVMADPVELDQIVLNLVVNARDAVGTGGEVIVSTERIELGVGEVAKLPALAPGPHVRLIVSDNGEGMAAEVLDHVFEPFFTTKGRGQGTGLGLSTVYGIVQRQGGHVSVRSTPGAGTTIEVLLPVHLDPSHATEPGPVASIGSS